MFADVSFIKVEAKVLSWDIPCWMSISIEHMLSVHRYEFQMQFGSIGWSVGATLGYAQALKGKKRVIASIGDGSFQVTAQVRKAASLHISWE